MATEYTKDADMTSGTSNGDLSEEDMLWETILTRTLAFKIGDYLTDKFGKTSSASAVNKIPKIQDQVTVIDDPHIIPNQQYADDTDSNSTPDDTIAPLEFFIDTTPSEIKPSLKIPKPDSSLEFVSLKQDRSKRKKKRGQGQRQRKIIPGDDIYLEPQHRHMFDKCNSNQSESLIQSIVDETLEDPEVCDALMKWLASQREAERLYRDIVEPPNHVESNERTDDTRHPKRRRHTVSRLGGVSDDAKPRAGSVVGGSAAPIDKTNIGHKMLAAMGWKQGDALGKEGNGILNPLTVLVRKQRAGLGKSLK